MNVISICHEHNIKETLSTKIDIKKNIYFRAIIKASRSLKESSPL